MSSVIVNFHRIDDASWFEKEILSLKKQYTLLSTAELDSVLHSAKAFKNICHITFDDGDRSFYEIAFPLLKKHQIPVSHFVSPQAARKQQNFWFQEIEGYNQEILRQILLNELKLSQTQTAGISLGSIFKSLPVERMQLCIQIYQKETGTAPKAPQNMSVEQLREVADSGFVCLGAHTQTHPILQNQPDESSQGEIRDSIQDLKKLLHRDIRYFAYPNGLPGLDYGQREIETLKQEGIRLAFSTDSRHLRKQDDLYNLPRIGLSPRNPVNPIKLKLGKNWELIRKVFASSPIKERQTIRKLLQAQ
ncbi:MAG: polysaccharide deacetylase family protein [Bacteroidetes bacterium]|nr:polysaccharide deacetylase family protein [Bacteroidota bacterium]